MLCSAVRPNNGLDATIRPTLLPEHDPPSSTTFAQLSTFSPFVIFKVRCGSHGDVFQPTAGPSLNIRHSKTEETTRDLERPGGTEYLYNLIYLR